MCKSVSKTLTNHTFHSLTTYRSEMLIPNDDNPFLLSFTFTSVFSFMDAIATCFACLIDSSAADVVDNDDGVDGVGVMRDVPPDVVRAASGGGSDAAAVAAAVAAAAVDVVDDDVDERVTGVEASGDDVRAISSAVSVLPPSSLLPASSWFFFFF